jgi:hypothetical protein
VQTENSKASPLYGLVGDYFDRFEDLYAERFTRHPWALAAGRPRGSRHIKPGVNFKKTAGNQQALEEISAYAEKQYARGGSAVCD